MTRHQDDLSNEQLYNRLRHLCGRVGCTTCGGPWTVAHMTERYKTKRAVEHRLCQLSSVQLCGLLFKPEFHLLLNLLGEPVWSRMVRRLSRRLPQPSISFGREVLVNYPLLPSGRITALEAMVIFHAYFKPEERDQVIERWLPGRLEGLRAASEARDAAGWEEARRRREAWEAAHPNWREEEKARQEEARQRTLAQGEWARKVTVHDAARRAAKPMEASIGLKKAIERDDTRRITALLAKGADPHYRFENGCSAIEYAILLGQEASLALLRPGQGRPSGSQPESDDGNHGPQDPGSGTRP